jgi:hypothetical protein
MLGEEGRRSIPPERRPRASLLQLLYSPRSGQRKTRFRGLDCVAWMFAFAAGAYNLVLMRNPEQRSVIVKGGGKGTCS